MDCTPPPPQFIRTYFGWTSGVQNTMKEYARCRAEVDAIRRLGFAGPSDPRYWQYKRQQNIEAARVKNQQNAAACELCKRQWTATYGEPYRGETEYDDFYHFDYTCSQCSHDVRQLENRY